MNSCSYTQFLYPSPIWILTIISDTNGLFAILLPGEAPVWPLLKNIRACTGQNPIITATIRALDNFFSGNTYHLPPLSYPGGTPLQHRTWRELGNIPRWETRSYAEIAKAIGKPRAIRAVASAIGKNPHPILLPCHRVIWSDGKLHGYAGGAEMKAKLLMLEESAKIPDGKNL